MNALFGLAAVLAVAAATPSLTDCGTARSSAKQTLLADSSGPTRGGHDTAQLADASGPSPNGRDAAMA